jgi:hypothetical protein
MRSMTRLADPEGGGGVSFSGVGDVSALPPLGATGREQGVGFDIAVTGGTGAYQNARGELRIRRGDEIAVRLIP